MDKCYDEETKLKSKIESEKKEELINSILYYVKNEAEIDSLAEVQNFVDYLFSQKYSVEKWHKVSEKDLPKRNYEDELDRIIYCKYEINGYVGYQELVYNFNLEKFILYHFDNFEEYNVLAWCELPELKED